jgi:hypothetical protein
MVEIYSIDNTFLPTLSGDFKKGSEGVVAYFSHFMEKDPVGTILEYEVQSISEVAFTHSGMYRFEVGPASERTLVMARFTFVWSRDQEGNWKIIHHHSSLKP